MNDSELVVNDELNGILKRFPNNNIKYACAYGSGKWMDTGEKEKSHAIILFITNFFFFFNWGLLLKESFPNEIM